MPEVEGPLESSFWLLVSSLQPLLSVLREEHSIFRGKKNSSLFDACNVSVFEQ